MYYLCAGGFAGKLALPFLFYVANTPYLYPIGHRHLVSFLTSYQLCAKNIYEKS